MGRICLSYLREPETDRWIPGDRWVRPIVRRVVRGIPRPGGLDKVFINLRLGLDRLGVPYEANLPYGKLRPDDLLGVLGRGRHCLDGYKRKEGFVAGIGLMTHPSEWPNLFDEFPVRCYLQHSDWTAAVYRPYFGDRCRVWPVGIDTVRWHPKGKLEDKPIDILIYDKISWDRDRMGRELLDPILRALGRVGSVYKVLRYGGYTPAEYQSSLDNAKGMVFLSSHESQGIACQEAMASGVPIFAWDQGFCLDPERIKWGQAVIPASSVPYFDARCGERFRDAAGFEGALGNFLGKLRSGGYSPRDYILENLTVERSSEKFVQILRDALT